MLDLFWMEIQKSVAFDLVLLQTNLIQLSLLTYYIYVLFQLLV